MSNFIFYQKSKSFKKIKKLYIIMKLNLFTFNKSKNIDKKLNNEIINIKLFL